MKYKYKPKTKKELVKAIKKEIYEIQGTLGNPNWQADLNCIDTSLITDMSYLFADANFMTENFKLNKFNGNISKWNVSNVRNMNHMFTNSNFNRDISNWNIINAEQVFCMFYNSKFNQDISNWKVYNIENIKYIFKKSDFNKDIGNWPKYAKKESGLENISVSVRHFKLPDEVKYPETVANIFNFVITNPESQRITKNQAVNILIEWLNNKRKEFKSKNLKKGVVKQLLTNYFLDIYKNIDNKKEFSNLLRSKNVKINLDI